MMLFYDETVTMGAHMFSGKKLLITGGTGSFGNALLKRFVHLDFDEIRILSRDEKKQDDMRKLYKNEKLRFFLGDTRDRNSIAGAIKGADYVFHAAALKQVPSCEFFPIEAVKTNILGSENVMDLGVQLGVERIICLSTDKAVQPVNAMGMTKALMEKTMVAKSLDAQKTGTTICGTRYGNVIASRGSVIPLFLDQIKKNVPLTITDPTMTRFMMSLDEAIDLVLFAFQEGNPGDIFVQKSPGASLETISRSVLSLVEKPDHPTIIMGERHGEKLHEVLLSKQERLKAVDLDNYFKIPSDTRGLNYGSYFEAEKLDARSIDEYNSMNTEQLTVEELSNVLFKLNLMNAE
jgi:UDP-N-acetylglucosamine 4,6-dehydratase